MCVYVRVHMSTCVHVCECVRTHVYVCVCVCAPASECGVVEQKVRNHR